MKGILLVVTLVITGSVSGQRILSPTDSLHIIGNVRSAKIYSLSDLDTFPKTAIHDQIIYNQKGEVKDSIKNIKGVLLKTLLSQVELVYEKPKELNEFFFVLTASDGYRIILSWNEIYNTSIGDQFFVITELEGKTIKEMKERILFLSAGDLKAGRRYVQALDRIDVKRDN